jgi:hypothetical protein
VGERACDGFDEGREAGGGGGDVVAGADEGGGGIVGGRPDEGVACGGGGGGDDKEGEGGDAGVEFVEVGGYFGGGEDVVAVLAVCEVIVAEVGAVGLLALSISDERINVGG